MKICIWLMRFERIEELRTFMSSTTEEEFLADPMRQSFVFHRLVIVGESAVSLRPAYGTRYPEVPWAQLGGLRNRLVHAYFDLNLPRLWNIAAGGLAELEEQFQRILRAEFPDAGKPEV